MVTKTLTNPEMLRSKSSIIDVIQSIEEFERMNKTSGAIVKVQNRSLGAYYDIVSLKDAQQNYRKWVGCDIYLKFWEKNYFLDLLRNYS